MNMVKTAMLIAFMTALFMGVGFMIGGTGGMMIALVIAACMNLFSYWKYNYYGGLWRNFGGILLKQVVATCVCKRS